MGNVTRILSSIEQGDRAASEQLLPLVYQELRKLAARRLAAEQPGQTIQATALVHEVYLRLVDAEHQQHWDSRGHFFAAAAQAMRRILLDNARRRKSLKRGGALNRVDAELASLAIAEEPLDLIELDRALTKLAVLHARKAQLVELRFFSGLTMEQAAAAIGISVATAQRDWTYARAWLHREMNSESPKQAAD